MDATQINELKAWAARLEERTPSDELKAAGKAIAMLVGEVEALEARLASAAGGAPAEPAPAPGAATPAVDQMWETADARTQGSLRSRLKRAFGFE